MKPWSVPPAATCPWVLAFSMLLAACFGRLGEPEAAAKAWRQVFEANPEFSIAQRRRTAFYRDKQHFEDIVDGLRLAGIDPDTAP